MFDPITKDLSRWKAMRKERAAKVRIGGKLYTIFSDDDYLKHIGGDFEPFMVSLFQCLVDDGDIVLDVGANIGCTAILFGDLAQEVRALNLPEVDFIKIDVEGFEGSVLRGGQQTLFAYRPVAVMELNHWCLNAL